MPLGSHPSQRTGDMVNYFTRMVIEATRFYTQLATTQSTTSTDITQSWASPSEDEAWGDL